MHVSSSARLPAGCLAKKTGAACESGKNKIEEKELEIKEIIELGETENLQLKDQLS